MAKETKSTPAFVPPPKVEHDQPTGPRLKAEEPTIRLAQGGAGVQRGLAVKKAWRAKRVRHGLSWAQRKGRSLTYCASRGR
jgi:hypothetical protein